MCKTMEQNEGQEAIPASKMCRSEAGLGLQPEGYARFERAESAVYY